MSNKEQKCKCDNPENGDIIIHNDEGRCVVCGRQYPVWTVPSNTLNDISPEEALKLKAKYPDSVHFAPSQQVERKCECNSVGAHHSDCPMSMCFFKN